MVDWLSLSQLSGSGDTEVTVTASSYSDFYERYTQLTVSGVTKSVRIPVTQYPDVPPMEGEYLTIECIGSVSGVLTFALGDYGWINSWISINGGEWTVPGWAGEVTVQPGDKIRIKSTVGGLSESPLVTDDGASRYRIYGNIMSMWFGDDFAGRTEKPSSEYFGFSAYFSGFTGLVDASYLMLPIMSLSGATSVYAEMFRDCTNLLHGPRVLPATVLARGCYGGMFRGCTSLVDTPELPATALENGCYNSMFQDCTSLVEPPILPASGEAKNMCYLNMFKGCTSLRRAPALPARTMFIGEDPLTRLTGECYEGMFEGCTSLTSAPPELPITTLATSCYRDMFRGCTSLTSAPALPATTLAEGCYAYMFYGCTSLRETPVLAASYLIGGREPDGDIRDNGCYDRMFGGCTSLSRVICLATSVGPNPVTWGDPTRHWLYNVSSTGTFVKSSQANSWTSGIDGIPNNWTVENV